MSFSTMSIWILALIFLAGLACIIQGGSAFVDGSASLAEQAGVPPVLIGATIVSLATTMPELLVSVFAAAQGSTELAVGTAVGSVTANTGLILAAALLFMPGRAPRKTYFGKCFLLLAAIVTLAVFTRSGELILPGVLVLVTLFTVFFVENMFLARDTHAETVSAAGDKKTAAPKGTAAKNILLFLFGAAGILIGAQLLVRSASAIAERLGVPEAVIAVTIVAVGTSLPELVTTITAIVKKQAALSIGNILGANLLDTALILPLCGLISGRALPIGAQSLALDIPVCLVCTAIALLPPLLAERFYRWQGAALLAVYLCYLGFVVF